MRRLIPINDYLYAYRGANWAAVSRLIGYLPDNTWKKKLIKLLVKALVRLNVLGLNTTTEKHRFSSITEVFDVYDSSIIFSGKLSRRSRFYCFSESNGEDLFHKIVWGEEKAAVRRGLKIIDGLRNLVRDFETNLPLSLRENGEYLMVTYPLIPSSFHLISNRPYGIADKIGRCQMKLVCRSSLR